MPPDNTITNSLLSRTQLPPHATHMAPGSAIRSQRSFAEVMSIADRGPLATAPNPREIAETFVSVALVQPILAQARETTWAAEPFAPSQAEKQFGALLDAQVAREITSAARLPLVDRLARDMRRV